MFSLEDCNDTDNKSHISPVSGEAAVQRHHDTVCAETCTDSIPDQSDQALPEPNRPTANLAGHGKPCEYLAIADKDDHDDGNTPVHIRTLGNATHACSEDTRKHPSEKGAVQKSTDDDNKVIEKQHNKVLNARQGSQHAADEHTSMTQTPSK